MDGLERGRGRVVVIGGPTATGKSGLALDIAQAFGGVVINADSMQIYRELRILTARPSEDDEALVAHRLYGALAASERGSAARWRALALAEIAAAHHAGRLPVIVGGTGLYLRALMEGLCEVPQVPESVRQHARERLDTLGGAAFRAELVAQDPASAILNPGDRQRLTRAWEVLTATGRPLSDWQAGVPDGPPPGLAFHAFVLDPPRAELYASCDGRLARMVERGALDEVRGLEAAALDPALPVMKALGVPELRRHLDGGLSLDEAVTLAQQATRRYAKRQVTWFRHQMIERPPGKGQHGCHVVPSLYQSSLRNVIVGDLEAKLRG